MRLRANNRYNTTLTAPFDGASDVTMKVKSLPALLPTFLTLNYATSTESTWQVTGSSGNDTLTGLTRIRGVEATYYEGTPVDCLNWADFYNQYFDVATFFFSEDQTDYSGAWNNQYVLSISDTNFDLTRGTLVAFEPIETNTGAVTIKINTLEPQVLTKNGGEALVAGDMVAGQIVTMVYDGTNLQLLSVSPDEATPNAPGISRPDGLTQTISSGVTSNILATQTEAEAGVNDKKGMTPLTVKQSIDYRTASKTYQPITVTSGAGTITVTNANRYFSASLSENTVLTISGLTGGVIALHTANTAAITSLTFQDDSATPVTITPVGDLDLTSGGVNDICFQYTPSGIVGSVRAKE